MTTVKYYDQVDDSLLKFAVIITKTDGKWVFCKHKERDTWEVPGGHRESGENINDTAKRELYEETGALEYDISPVCVYSVIAPNNFGGAETFGMLFYAEVFGFENELHSEIEKISIMDAESRKRIYYAFCGYPDDEKSVMDDKYGRLSYEVVFNHMLDGEASGFIPHEVHAIIGNEKEGSFNTRDLIQAELYAYSDLNNDSNIDETDMKIGLATELCSRFFWDEGGIIDDGVFDIYKPLDLFDPSDAANSRIEVTSAGTITAKAANDSDIYINRYRYTINLGKTNEGANVSASGYVYGLNSYNQILVYTGNTVGTKDGSFTKSVAGSYTVGETYTVYVADYEGGSWATFTEIAVADPQSPPPSTPTSDPTPDSGSNNSNLGTTPTTTPAETPKAKGPAKKETTTEETPGRTESDTEEVAEKEETTEESVQDIKEPVKETEEVVTENTETKEPEKTAVAETKEPKKEGKINKILLVVVAIIATCAIASGIILFALKKKEES